jgi:hypothetical protein
VYAKAGVNAIVQLYDRTCHVGGLMPDASALETVRERVGLEVGQIAAKRNVTMQSWVTDQEPRFSAKGFVSVLATRNTLIGLVSAQPEGTIPVDILVADAAGSK